ncbi:MAG: MGMT family protein [bacterium]|nr:MGMT family protein [bacterium]
MDYKQSLFATQHKQSLSSYKQEVYEAVKKIPKGKVATYGEISEMINAKCLPAGKAGQMTNGKSRITARMVGRALHNNPDPENIPCHRVVDRNGRIAESFAFGGAEEQRRRLVEEGVKFRDNTHVDLKRSLWER